MRLTLKSGVFALAILGGFSSVVSAEPKLTVSFKTVQVGGFWAPLNVVGVWIRGPKVGDNPGPFVKTIGRWANVQKIDLIAWQNAAGPNDVDAVSGATRQNFDAELTAEWDLKNKLGVLVPDGIYTIRMEGSEANVSTEGENNQLTFTFTKGLVPEVQMIADAPGTRVNWLNVKIDYNPVANECNNGMVDTGETCDGNCPVDCPVAEDACAPNVVSGSAATCTARCVVQAITTCVSGDGCCAAGCGPVEDDDCASTGDLNQTGCAAGAGGDTGALLAFSMLGLAVLLTRRR